MKRILGSLVVLAAVLVGPAAQGVQAAIPAVVTQSPQTVALQPAADVLATNVVAVRNGSIAKSGALWPYVDDGTSFASADDGATLVRSAARVASAAHETSYADVPAGVVTEAFVHVRADRTQRASGSIQVLLYDGATRIAVGAPHAVGDNWGNFGDDFTGLQLADPSSLRTYVRFCNSAGRGAIEYTELWTPLTYQPSSAAAVDAPPVVTISSPVSGAVVHGSVALAGTATDDVGVSAISLSVDGGPQTSLGTGPAWSYAWDSTGSALGTHVLAVSAVDSSGQTTTQQVSVNVDAPPVVSVST